MIVNTQLKKVIFTLISSHWIVLVNFLPHFKDLIVSHADRLFTFCDKSNHDYKKFMLSIYTSQWSGFQGCFDWNVVCSCLCDEEKNDGEADRSGSVIPLPPNSLSPQDIKSYGVSTEPSHLMVKQALSGILISLFVLTKRVMMMKQRGLAMTFPLHLSHFLVKM